MVFDGSFALRPRVKPPRGWRAWLAGRRETRAARRLLRDCLLVDPRFARDIGVDTVSPVWKELRR